MKIERTENVLRVPASFDELLSMIDKNNPSIRLSDFSKLIKDYLSIKNGNITTKIVNKIKNRYLYIYKINEYSIVRLTSCKEILLVKTDNIESVLDKLSNFINTHKITVRYGLVSGKMLGISFYTDEGEYIDRLIGIYYTYQSCDLFNNQRVQSDKFKNDYELNITKYSNFLNQLNEI